MSKQKDVTIYDIANQLNVSSATVSRALGDDPTVSKKTRERITQMAEKMGYQQNYFAKNLRKRETNTIGFMVHELHSNFINSVLAGVEKVTTNAGYDLIIAHSLESHVIEEANAKNLFYKRVDGLITSLSFDTRNLDHFRPFVEKGVPIVFFDRVEPTPDNTVVIIDNYKSGYQATCHLIEQGCRRIAHITSSLVRNVYSERYRGYRDALAKHGISFDDSLVVVDDLSERAAVGSAGRILSMAVRPDGAFITNDFVAAVFMRTLKENHIRVPQDIAIVGFNNDAIGTVVEPALTTIDYPGKEMGEAAARNLINRLTGVRGSRPVETIILNSGLIVRKSSLKRGL